MLDSVNIDLASLAAKQGKRRDLTLRPIQPTQAMAQELAALYLAVMKAWDINAIMAGYSPVHRDSPADNAGTIQQIENTVTRLVAEFAANLSRWTVKTETWHRRKWIDAVKAGTDVDLSSILTGGSVNESVQVFIERNIALVKDVSAQTRGRIADAIFRGYQEGQPPRDVAKAIREATGMARDRSLRIAMDQSSKFSAALDRERQAEAGIDLFRWRHSGKVHPRSWHKARDGHIYDRANGRQMNPDGTPMDGGETVERGDFPGEPPYCGCRAQAYLPLMAELGL